MPDLPVPGRRARAQEAKRARIREAAWSLFTERGFEGTTLDDVARKADVAKGTVLLYASDKEDLLVLAVHGGVEQVVEQALATLPSVPVVERWMHVFSALFAFYAPHPALARRVLSVLPVAHGKNGRSFSQYSLGFLQRLARDFERTIGESSSDVSSMTVASTAFASYLFALQAWASGGVDQRVALEGILRPSLELLRDGFAPAR